MIFLQLSIAHLSLSTTNQQKGDSAKSHRVKEQEYKLTDIVKKKNALPPEKWRVKSLSKPAYP